MPSNMPAASATLVSNDFKNHQPKGVATKRQCEALYALGFELYSEGYFDKAADLFRLNCFYEPENPRNWIALGGANQHIKNYDTAIAAFLMATHHDPLNPEPRLYLAHSFIDAQDISAALESARAALILCGNKEDHEKIKAKAFALCQALEKFIPAKS